MIRDVYHQYKKNICKYLDIDNKSILEIGCGKGVLTEQLIANNQVNAIDPVESFINIVREKYPLVNAHVGFAEQLNFEDSSLDIVVYCLSFHHVTDMNRALEEANRVLKADGLVCIFELLENGSYIECESLFFDESKQRRASHRIIDQNKFFHIVHDDSFVVTYSWKNNDEFFETAVQQPKDKLSEETINKINALLTANTINGRILLDEGTRIVVSKKIQ